MNFAKFLKRPFLQNTTVRLLLLIFLPSKYFHDLIKSLFYSNVLSRTLEQFANIKEKWNAKENNREQNHENQTHFKC